MGKKIDKVMLFHPDYSILGKRTWKLPPYNLAILNACLKPKYNSWIFDPNFLSLTEEEVRAELRKSKPDVVGITSYSTEYMDEQRKISSIIKEELPESILVFGGVVPTVIPDQAMEDPNIDYCVIGEGEYRFPRLLDALNAGNKDELSKMDGLGMRSKGQVKINPRVEFIENLDEVPFPDYGDIDISAYGNNTVKFYAQMIPRKYPWAITIASRGCPFHCIFCAAESVTGRKVRCRSVDNVLEEIDLLYNKHGIREIIFLDDHFLANKKRAIDFMERLIDRNYDLTWKCGNVAVFALDERMLELMWKSGSYQITISVESGNQEVLDNIIKKPVNLKKASEMIKIAKSLGFEIICNFVIGFPDETWEQIRDSLNYADKIDVDMVNFHVATPLPKTELMDIAVERGYVRLEDKLSGYTKSIFATSEFTSEELQIVRAFEWDRINFKTKEKINKIARMEGLTVEEVQDWRIKTRRSLGVTTDWKSKMGKIDG